MNFKQGSNSFAFGKIKLGSTSINKIYFGSNFVWPEATPIPGECYLECDAVATLPIPGECYVECDAVATLPIPEECYVECDAIVN